MLYLFAFNKPEKYSCMQLDYISVLLLDYMHLFNLKKNDNI